MQEVHRQLLVDALKAMSYVVVADAQNRIVYIDKEYQSILGVDDASSLGRDVLSVIPNSGIPRVAKSQKAEFGTLFTFKNGQVVVVNRFPIFQEGAFAGVVTTATFNVLDQVRQLKEEIDQLQADNQRYKDKLAQLLPDYQLDRIVGQSPAIQALRQQIQNHADSLLAVLITGAPGTGKDTVADAIHALSSRRGELMVKVDCAAIPAEHLDLELFGSKDHAPIQQGKLEKAAKGSLQLTEVGEMPLTTQTRLLRILQEGSREGISLPRLICTSSRNLEDLIAQGSFRRDLYYWLNIVDIHLSPLKERMEDLAGLVDSFITRTARAFGLAVKGCQADALQLLAQYEWPGNVLELCQAVERACLAAGSGPLGSQHFAFLIPRIRHLSQSQDSQAAGLLDTALGTAVEELEKNHILEALAQCRGNKSAAARLLGIERASLYRKLDKYGIPAK